MHPTSTLHLDLTAMAPVDGVVAAVGGSTAVAAAATADARQPPPQQAYPVKRFVYVIANVTALSGLLFGCVGGLQGCL